MRDPNFITPNRSPRCTIVALAHAADDAARQDADDLPDDDRAAVVDQTSVHSLRSPASRR